MYLELESTWIVPLVEVDVPSNVGPECRAPTSLKCRATPVRAFVVLDTKCFRQQADGACHARWRTSLSRAQRAAFSKVDPLLDVCLSSSPYGRFSGLVFKHGTPQEKKKSLVRAIAQVKIVPKPDRFG